MRNLASSDLRLSTKFFARSWVYKTPLHYVSLHKLDSTIDLKIAAATLYGCEPSEQRRRPFASGTGLWQYQHNT